MERSVRAVGVVVLDVFLQHRREVAWSGDEGAVEAFAAESGDPAFAFARGARRGVRMMRISAPEHVEHESERVRKIWTATRWELVAEVSVSPRCPCKLRAARALRALPACGWSTVGLSRSYGPRAGGCG
jgi:hypothetical protein